MGFDLLKHKESHGRRHHRSWGEHIPPALKSSRSGGDKVKGAEGPTKRDYRNCNLISKYLKGEGNKRRLLILKKIRLSQFRKRKWESQKNFLARSSCEIVSSPSKLWRRPCLFHTQVLPAARRLPQPLCGFRLHARRLCAIACGALRLYLVQLLGGEGGVELKNNHLNMAKSHQKFRGICTPKLLLETTLCTASQLGFQA